MNISEAARLAVATGTSMTRKVWGKPSPVHITPTDTDDCCIIQVEGLNPGARWHPDAADLTATDWIVEGKRRRFTPKVKKGDWAAKILFKLLLLAIGKKRRGKYRTTVRFCGKIYELTIDEYILRLWEPEVRETESSR